MRTEPCENCAFVNLASWEGLCISCPCRDIKEWMELEEVPEELEAFEELEELETLKSLSWCLTDGIYLDGKPYMHKWEDVRIIGSAGDNAVWVETTDGRTAIVACNCIVEVESNSEI